MDDKLSDDKPINGDVIAECDGCGAKEIIGPARSIKRGESIAKRMIGEWAELHKSCKEASEKRGHSCSRPSISYPINGDPDAPRARVY